MAAYPQAEVELWDSSRERELMSSLGDYFVTIKTAHHLDKAFLAYSLPNDAYTEQCYRLIAQFKTLHANLTGNRSIASMERFMIDFGLENCTKARKRLVEDQVPITAMHSSSEARGASVHVAETVSRFITAMDALKLDMKAVDDIQPLVNDLCSSLNKHPREPPSTASDTVKAAVASLNEQRTGLTRWLTQLNSMSAHEELSDDQVRQLSHDLERAYASFHSTLS